MIPWILAKNMFGWQLDIGFWDFPHRHQYLYKIIHEIFDHLSIEL
jgi:hypothetical protein